MNVQINNIKNALFHRTDVFAGIDFNEKIASKDCINCTINMF